MPEWQGAASLVLGPPQSRVEKQGGIAGKLRAEVIGWQVRIRLYSSALLAASWFPCQPRTGDGRVRAQLRLPTRLGLTESPRLSC